MNTLEETIERARGYLGVGDVNEDSLTKLLWAVYNDGMKHERNECAVLCDKEAEKSAKARIRDDSTDSGMHVLAGRRLVAVELGGQIRSRGQGKVEDDKPRGNKRRAG